MNFEDIEFETRQGPWGPSVGIQLGVPWIFKDIVVETYRRARASDSKLDWSVQQTAESMYSDPDWRYIKVGRRLAIGRCVRFLADNDVLPLRVANPKAKGTKKYVRVPK